MKKLTLLIALAAFIQSFNAFSKEITIYRGWLGGFAQYYDADSDKPEPLGGFDNGHGFGGELGFRLDPNFAVRFEISRLLIDTQDIRTALADDGVQVGADIVYFLSEDKYYIFGGGREQILEENYIMAALGVGKHWKVAEDWRVITEVAAFHDFGQNFREYSAKLGLAYIFGKRQVFIDDPDSDGDGVRDPMDRCPDTPPGTVVDETGCNADLDGDGVLNTIDECPDTPLGTEVDDVGCPLNGADADGDGVIDAKDECPDTPVNNQVNEVGCTLLEEKEISIELEILFANNSSFIENPRAFNIGEFADFMRQYPETIAEIQGHTSAPGTDEYNQWLSEQRATKVRALLINEYDIDESRLTAVGYGESRLKFLDNTEEAHGYNRRIEAKVTAVIEEAVLK
ncbi:MAG: OmpA family protein [Pseudomonadota bacterium]